MIDAIAKTMLNTIYERHSKEVVSRENALRMLEDAYAAGYSAATIPPDRMFTREEMENAVTEAVRESQNESHKSMEQAVEAWTKLKFLRQILKDIGNLVD